MEPAPPPSTEDLFADYLDRIETGEQLDFEAYRLAHPAHAESLRIVHERWQVMTRAFQRLSSAGPDAETGGASKSLDGLKARLGAPGARLGRYALRHEIARGAMGRIVLAWDEELRREVVLKMQRGTPSDTRLQRRFLEEAQIAAQLDHPGIVPIHELGLDGDGRPFFSMQLVRGHDLGRILDDVREQRDGWTRTRVLIVLLRVCEAMAFAHERGVVHRDLKPANIMVGRFGETYVMDWGLAHVHGAEPADARAGDPVATLRQDIVGEANGSPLLTGHGDVVGTPAYMAPEQAGGGVAATAPAVDVYAVGAILYPLLAGAPPFATHSGADAVLRALRAGPPPPLPHDVPPELRAICEQAMARSPAARYASMLALADDMRAFLEVRTVRAYATGRFAGLRKWIARNRVLAALGGAFALALGVGTIVVTTLWVRAERDRERADVSASRLLTELDRSAFRAARQSLLLENSGDAADTLWRTHLVGRLPRATSWALLELAAHDPYLKTVPLDGAGMPVAPGGAVDVVLVGGTDGRLQVRDPQTLTVRAELGEGGARITSVVAPIATSLAVAGTVAGELLVFDLQTNTAVARTTPHRGSVRSLCATGGEGFASGGADGRVLWWSDARSTPRELLRLDGEVTALAPYSRGPGVVAGNEAGAVRGVAVDGGWRFGLDLDANQITSLAFGSVGPELWVGSTNHQLRFIDLLDQKNNRIEPTRNGTCRQLQRDRDGSLLLGGWWRIDRVSEKGKPLGSLALRGVSRMALDVERRRLLTSDQVHGLGIVDVDRRDRRLLPGGVVALSGDGKRYARFDGDRVVVRDVDSDEVVASTVAGYKGGRLRLDQTGAHLAIATRQPLRVEVIDLANGTITANSEGQVDDPRGDGCTFSRDGRELAVVVGTHRIRRLRTSDGEVLAEYSVPGARFTRTAYSADGCWLAAIRRGDPVVRVFELATGAARDESFANELTAGLALSAVALSADGGQLVVGTWNGGMLVRSRDGRTTVLPGHDGTVATLQFLTDDPHLLVSSGGVTGFACWDLEAMECCYQSRPDLMSQLQVSGDGRTLACSVPEGAVLIDLTYFRRHIAGDVDYRLRRMAGKVALAASRVEEVRAWAAAELARPWPRWR